MVTGLSFNVTFIRRLLASYIKTQVAFRGYINWFTTRGAGRSLARPTSRCISFDGKNISFDASLAINSTNIPSIMIEHQNLLSL